MLAATGAMAFSGLLAAPQEGDHAAPGWDSLFSVDVGLAFWTVVTFLALLAILTRFAWKPLLGALDARAKGIQDDIDEARSQRDDAEELLDRYREQLAEGRRQAQALIAESREAAEQLRRELELRAREERARGARSSASATRRLRPSAGSRSRWRWPLLRGCWASGWTRSVTDSW